MKYTHIIWDFNGTILDDVKASIKSVNTLLTERGLPIIESVEKYQQVFGFPIIDYYRRLGFDFDKEPYEVIAPLWVALYLENVKASTFFSDVRETAEHFRNVGAKQIILSATELEMLKKQLSDLGISDSFDEIYGLDNIHAASKVAIAEEWRAENPDAKALMIGDTVHDAEVAKKIGADCVLVSRGHQSYETLSMCGFRVLSSLKEIPNLLK